MTARFRKIVAWWQIACGVLGILGLGISASDWPVGSRRVLLEIIGPVNLILGLTFFILCIFFGSDLLRGARRGIVGTIVCQALQVISFAFVDGPHVAIAAGPRISLFVSAVRIEANVGFNSQFFLGTRVSGVPWEFAINLLAIVWVVALTRRLNAPDAAPVEFTPAAPAVPIQGSEERSGAWPPLNWP